MSHRIGYYHGDMSQIVQDIKVLRPDILNGVPRVYNKFYDSMMSVIRQFPRIKKKIILNAINVKMQNYETRGTVKHFLYDSFVLSKLRQSIGGKVTAMINGGAPIEPKVLSTLRVMLSAPIIQGYGLTETGAAVTLSYEQDIVPGSIGCPTIASEIKLVDVPEMEYTSRDIVEGRSMPRGELCVRSISNMHRYFRNEELTATVIDSDGWLHTGDIAALIRPQGVLRLIDRKKNLFKLQHGDYVSPEKLENVYSTSRYVAQIFIHGESTESYVVGLVVPNYGILAKERCRRLIRNIFLFRSA